MITLSPEELAARKRRNLWIALGLVGFIVLVFTTTVLRLNQNQDDAAATAEDSFLRPARQMRAAGYVMHGPRCLMVLTCGDGVQVQALDDLFVLKRQSIAQMEQVDLVSRRQRAPRKRTS